MQEQRRQIQELTARLTSEVAELRGRLVVTEAENHRLKVATPVDAGRLSRLEVENSMLRAQLSDPSCHRGSSQPLVSPPMSPLIGHRFSANDQQVEAAARRLQRAVRRWLDARPVRRGRDSARLDDSGVDARDRFKRALLELEESVERAVDSAQCLEIGRVRLTRLEMLANVLKQGAFKVTQVKNLQSLQEMRRPASRFSSAVGISSST